MGWRIVQQPDGYFARFSTICDHFTDINLSEQEAVELCQLNNCTEETAKRAVLNALKNPERWNEAIEDIKAVHGETDPFFAEFSYGPCVSPDNLVWTDDHAKNIEVFRNLQRLRIENSSAFSSKCGELLVSAPSVWVPAILEDILLTPKTTDLSAIKVYIDELWSRYAPSSDIDTAPAVLARLAELYGLSGVSFGELMDRINSTHLAKRVMYQFSMRDLQFVSDQERSELFLDAMRATSSINAHLSTEILLNRLVSVYPETARILLRKIL